MSDPLQAVGHAAMEAQDYLVEDLEEGESVEFIVTVIACRNKDGQSYVRRTSTGGLWETRGVLARAAEL